MDKIEIGINYLQRVFRLLKNEHSKCRDFLLIVEVDVSQDEPLIPLESLDVLEEIYGDLKKNIFLVSCN